MAVTPLWVANGEPRNNIEYDLFNGNHPPNVTNQFVVGRSYLISTTTLAGKNIPATGHARFGYYFWIGTWAGSAANYQPLFGSFYDAGYIFAIMRLGSTNEVVPVINDSVQPAIGTLNELGLDTIGIWKHFGLVCQVGDPGFAAFYIDQNLIWSTTQAITGNSTSVRIGSTSGSNYSSGGLHTHFYCDDIGGETNGPPPPYIFANRLTNAAGADAAFDSTELENHLAVDENPHDGDTSYNFTDVNAQRDTFQASSMGELEGYNIIARHPYVIARRAGESGTIKLHTHDGTVYKTGPEKTLQNDYRLIMDTQTSMPNNSAFTTEAALDATQVGYESAGF